MRRVSWNLANRHATVQKLLVRQVLNISKLWSWRVKVGRCVMNMRTQPWRESLSLSYTCHKQTDDGRVMYITCIPTTCCGEIFSRDPDHAHLGNTHSSQDKFFAWPSRVQNLKSLALAVAEILHGVKILKRVSWLWPRPFQGRVFIGRVGLAMISQCTKFEVSRFTCYEAMNSGAKCRKWGGLGAFKVMGNATIR